MAAGSTKQEPPTIFVLIDRDNKPTTIPTTVEREAYKEKSEYAEAGVTVRVVKYVPERKAE